MKVAIIGTGIAGNVVAHHLHRTHDITVYEAADHIGGHTHTHDIELDGERHAIDTGFIVFNRRTYPNFIALLNQLGVASQPSEMSFSVRNENNGLEYNGTSINGLFAQRRNLLRPSFHRMILDILRFNREAPELLADESHNEVRLGDYLAEHRYSRRFIDDYLVPMGAAIWSTEPTRMLAFPAKFFVRFLHNHGMLSIDDRPQWRVIVGGSARYLDKLVAPWRHHVRLRCPVEQVQRSDDGGVLVSSLAHGTERYDHVFFACHADQALRLLADPTRAECEVLGALPYQRNDAVLHTDTRLLPRTRRAWAAWNYHVRSDRAAAIGGQRVALTYDMNILQSLRSKHTFCVTLNRGDEVDPRHVLKRLTYHHPLFTPAGVAAQARHAEVSGMRGTHYCGAYWRYGFHEDGVVSALNALHLFERAAHAQRDLQRVA